MSSFTGYERELKAILQGEKQTGSAHVLVQDLVDHPFMVIRAAGSHGMDLVALRRGRGYPIEVKASHQDNVPFSSASGRGQEQFEELRQRSRKADMPLFYGLRKIGGKTDDEPPWRFYSATRLSHRIPVVNRTKEGNRILRWSEGVDLGDWLAAIGVL